MPPKKNKGSILNADVLARASLTFYDDDPDLPSTKVPLAPKVPTEAELLDAGSLQHEIDHHAPRLLGQTVDLSFEGTGDGAA